MTLLAFSLTWLSVGIVAGLIIGGGIVFLIGAYALGSAMRGLNW